MYLHERTKTPDRPKSRHIAAKAAEKTAAGQISNQFALSRNITQMQPFDSDPDELHGKLTKRIGFRRNNGLPLQLQNGIENLSGYSMDGVRVHYNSPRPAQLQALAYAKGEDIYVAPGQEKHLPHEVWHIVQQKQGRAVTTGRVNGVNINDNPVLEHEADVMGAKAVQLRSAEGNGTIRLQNAQEPAAQLKPKHSKHSKHSKPQSNYSWSMPPQPEGLDTDTYFPEEKRAYERTFRAIEQIIGGAQLMQDNRKFALEEKKMSYDKLTGIWDHIKKVFSTTENINMIIYKIFRTNEYENKKYNFFNAISQLFYKYTERGDSWTTLLDDMNVTVSATLNDIFFWNLSTTRQSRRSRSRQLQGNAVSREVCKTIIDIKLTDSDIHARGLGVCSITFDDNEKLMIKPEQRSFEKIVYGKKDGQQTSLAAVFNSIVKPYAISKEKDSGVGELTIRTSEDHGSAIEYFPHKQMKHMDKNEKSSIDTEALINTIIFSSIMGLADLHYENMVYGCGKVQLIDAEVGLKYLLDSRNPLSSAINSGEMVTYLGRSIPEGFNSDFTKYQKTTFLQELIKFLNDDVMKNLQNQRVRIVIFRTSDLYTWRDDVYAEKRNTNANNILNFSFYNNKLLEFINKNNSKGGKGKLENTVNDAYVKMIEDFKKGKLPFYEVDLNTGNIYQKTSVGEFHIISDPKKSLKDIIQKNVNVLKDINRTNMIKKVVGTTAAAAAAFAAYFKFFRN